MLHVLRLGRHDVVDPVELAACARLFALLDVCQGRVDALLAFVVVVLDVFLLAVEEVQTAGDEDGYYAYGALSMGLSVAWVAKHTGVPP